MQEEVRELDSANVPEPTVVPESTSVPIPDSVIMRDRLNRFSDIFGRMSIVSMILALTLCGMVVLLPVMFGMVYILLGFLVIIASAGMIFVTFGVILLAGEESPLAQMWGFLGSIGDAEVIPKFLDIMGMAFPIVCAVGIVVSALSMLFAIFGKSHKRVSKIVGAIVSIVVFIIFILVRIIGGQLWVG